MSRITGGAIEVRARYTTIGADLVVISGEKGLEGPQSTGILAGPKDLLEAASLNHSHNTTSKSAHASLSPIHRAPSDNAVG